MENNISYNTFIYRIIYLGIFIILGVFIMYIIFIHSNTIKQSIKKDTNVITELVFQNLYTVMKSGGNKEVLDDTIENLSKKIPELKIDVIQNPDNTSSEIVKNSFITKKVELIQKDLNVQFVAPILFTQECLQCHSNSKANDVAGVIFMEHSILDVKLSFNDILLMTFVLFVIIILVFFFIWFYSIKRHFINPIENLISQVSNHKTHKDSKTKIVVSSKIREIKFLEEVFNTKNTELFKSYNELRKSNFTDSLTGIYNRKKFDEYSNLTLNNAKRTNIPFSIVMIDLNKFKPINDTYGHHIGDDVLILFSKTIKKHIRNTDYLFRLGGDEFCLILNNTDSIGANNIVKKLQEILLETKFIKDNIKININASFGIAEYKVHGNNIDELIKVADFRMYENKKTSHYDIRNEKC